VELVVKMLDGRMEEKIIGNTPMPKKLVKQIQELLENEWSFLDKPWPMCPKIKTFHHSEVKPIPRIQEMKDVLKKRLGSITVVAYHPSHCLVIS
jgi:hypothetical protein